jgi:hypothetical protein
VSTLRITISSKKHPEAKGTVYHLITFSFSRFGQREVKYYGEIDLDEIEKHIEGLKEFELDGQMIKEIRSFKVGGYGAPNQWFWVWIIPYDLLQSPEEYAAEFLASFQITFRNKIIEEFGEKINFVTKYRLKHEPVLPFHELLTRDPLFSSFAKVDQFGGRSEFTIEDIQENVSGIQLIPAVPDEIKKLFRSAKKLFIFGFFEHSFFNISLHYAYLAMDAALRFRCLELFGGPAGSPGLDEIIGRLVEKGIIPKGEAKFYDARREFKNALSYLGDTSILTPLSGTLERLAYQINHMFDKG